LARSNATIAVGRIVIDPEGYEVRVDGQTVDLTLTQFRLLTAMARRPGWVHTADQLGRAAAESPPAAQVRVAALKNHIYHLRRKLGPAGAHLQTVRGLGYRLQPTPDAEPSTDAPRDPTPNA
jgi:DNA-binding response OmpR family regulator